MTGQTVAVPVLPVSDVVRSTAWYERLGFTCEAAYDGYAILSIDGAEVHLGQIDDLPPAGMSVSGAYLRVTDADATFARWTALGAPPVAAPADQPYGIREFATEDLDGNLWRVGSPLHTDDDPLDEGVTAARVDPGTSAPAGAEPVEPADEVALAVERTDGGPGTSDDAWFALVSGPDACAGCGMVAGELHVRALGAQVRDEVHAFGERLTQADDAAIRRRPAPGSWSALEYGVHVRDLLTVFAERIIRTLAEHEPELGWWDHEAAIADGMANESDVFAVADDLGRNASKLSEALRLVDEDDWQRAGIRRGTERFTIELMARFALHEVVHHRVDADAALAAAAAATGQA